MTPEEIQNLLKKFRLGECTDREVEIINNWYNSLEEQNELSILNDEIDLQEIKNTMSKEINKRIDSFEQKRNILLWNHLSKVAAVIVILIGILFIYQKKQEIPNHNPAQVTVKISEKKFIHSKKILLADGSVVWLKHGSKLDYPKEFKTGIREVTLTGEAFFEVFRDVRRPFIIHSEYIDTKVLGTSFNIKAYQHDNHAEVTVVTGKVSVALKNAGPSKTKEVILEPNQKVTYLKEFNKMVRLEETNALKYKMVAKNEMVFEEASMKDILNTMALAYNTEIVVENEKISNCIITADLSGQTLETSLEILTRSIGAHYFQKGNKIWITGKGCDNN